MSAGQPTPSRLDGRVAVVIGATGGIGSACVAELAERGARIAAADLGERLRLVDLNITNATAYHEVDVADEQSVQRLFEVTRDSLGPIHIVVNAAGISEVNSVLQTSVDAWDRQFTVNARGNFLVGREAARHMIDQRVGGRIISIASILGLVPRLNNSAYCATKAAVIHHMRCMALELASAGITVNTVCPGPTMTPMLTQTQAAGDPGRLDAIVHGDLAGWRLGIPLGRVGWPIDQARAVGFLASDEAAYITGQSLCVDGGQTLVA